MVVLYFRQGRDFFAHATIACCCTSFVLQATIAVIQNKSDRRIMIRELLVLLTFMKPACDAWQLLSGNERGSKQTMSPSSEIMLCKGAELFGESIPGSFIQTFAFVTLDSSHRSSIALVSILVSISTTAFMSASISFDLDLDPFRRRVQPDMYGMIADSSSGRTATFASVFFLALMQIISKILACALIAASSPFLLVSILGGEMAL